MRIRLLEPYQLAAAGEYLDPAPGVAAQLIARGIAERPPEVIETRRATPPGAGHGGRTQRASAAVRRASGKRR